MSKTKPGEAKSFFTGALALRSDKCLIWPYMLNSAGYARIYIGKRPKTVSRLICEGVHGPCPSEKHFALHRPIVCHNRACINPRHLYWGTKQQNWEDSLQDGTYIEVRPRISEDIRAEIRRAVGTQAEIAKVFGISQSTVCQIKREK